MWTACVDPKGFVREGPTLTFFFILLEGSGLNTTVHYKRAITGPPAKCHLNGVSLSCR